MLRLKRICNKPSDYKKHIRTLIVHFRKRGYPDQLLAMSLMKCEGKSREELLSPTPKEKQLAIEEKIFMTTTFRTNDLTLEKIVMGNWDHLGRSKSTKKMHRRGICKSYKRPKILRDHLVRAATHYDPTVTTDERSKSTKNRCRRKNCPHCKKLDRTGHIKKYDSELSFKTKTIVSCCSSNLIYCVECTKCKIRYVGETQNPLKIRLQRHVYDTNKCNIKTDVQYHFGLPGHSMDRDMKVYILECF